MRAVILAWIAGSLAAFAVAQAARGAWAFVCVDVIFATLLTLAAVSESKVTP